MRVPLRVNAFAAAAGEPKSTKQYPALLCENMWLEGCDTSINKVGQSCSPRKLVANHLDADGFTHVVPDVADEVLINPGLKLTHPIAVDMLDKDRDNI